jgi:hypothetical protein
VVKSKGFKCGACGASTHEPRTCNVCGELVCPDCAHHWVEGHAVVCPDCANTLRAAVGKDTSGGLEEPT